MSLINQVLRDLQQQKKDGGPKTPGHLRTKKADRVPFLPLPLVLGGAALVLLCLVWWLAGVLSDMMFGFEPVAKSLAPQKIVATGQQRAAEINMSTAEPDQLTMAEREAEPPVAQVVEKAPAVANSQSGSEALVEQAPASKPKAIKPVPVDAKPSVAAPIHSRQGAASSRESKTPRPVLVRAAQSPTMAVAKPAKRLHPDDLPGAVLSHQHNLIETRSIDRPSRFQATTPYGMAEEAYLDGQWAFARERSNLAVRSLQHALVLYPGHLPARELLVEIFSQEGKTGEAMFLLAEGLEIAPDYIVFKKKYTRLLMDQGDYDAATKVMLNGGLPTVEDDPEAHVILASLYQRLGEPFLAAQTYRNLLVAWPQTGAFWVGLGGALEGQRLPEEAVVCYKRALETKDLRQDLSLYAKKRLNLLN